MSSGPGLPRAKSTGDCDRRAALVLRADAVYLSRMPHNNPKIIALGHAGEALTCATRAVSGDGLDTLRRWVDESDALFLTNGAGEPLVVVKWAAWTRAVRTMVNPRNGSKAAAETAQVVRD